MLCLQGGVRHSSPSHCSQKGRLFYNTPFSGSPPPTRALSLNRFGEGRKQQARVVPSDRSEGTTLACFACLRLSPTRVDKGTVSLIVGSSLTLFSYVIQPFSRVNQPQLPRPPIDHMIPKATCHIYIYIYIYIRYSSFNNKTTTSFLTPTLRYLGD